ncbi:MAG: bacteriophage holin [Nanoarchaeota archaeon]|nr:bacteriophage holin [Nanoarchaeota archaeon]
MAPKKTTKKKIVKKEQCNNCLDKKRWALTGSLLWGGLVLVLGLLNIWTGYGTEFITLFGSIYPGYNSTLFGTFIGTVWGLIDAFIGIWIFLWLYEKIVKLTA